MPNRIVPGHVRLAAKRGFIRTTAQAYAATLSAGVVTAGTIAAVINDPDPVLLVSTGVAALLSPALAGLASYLSILSGGIPDDYQPDAPNNGYVGRHREES